jgi:outer membrane protein assembly factor BamA
VYFPIFQTLIPLETPLSFINNLQLGMFSDLATANETWNNANPNNNTWFWSYGLSARTTLAGYPIRVEVAWPGMFSKQPVWYFSLNLR